MGELRSHKITANRIAKKYNTAYISDKGVDIVIKKVKVEVETEGNVKSGMQQLKGCKGRVYIAGVNQKTVSEALEKTKNTTIGVMDNQGNIKKRSTRKL